MQFHNVFFIGVTAFVLITSCSDSSPHDLSTGKKQQQLSLEYSNQKDLKNYFKNTFSKEIDLNSDTIFFIPLNSCDKCVDALMTTISKSEFKGLIVFGGDIEQTPIFKDKYLLLNENFNCLIDKQYQMYRYNLKIAETSLILSNRIYPINYGNLKQIRKVLSWK